MTSVLCSEGAIWAVQRTAGEGQSEKGVQPPQGMLAPAGDPAQAKGPGSWMAAPVGGPGWQSIAATRPSASARWGIWVVWVCWCCGPWPPALPGSGGFAPALNSQRARDCP